MSIWVGRVGFGMIIECFRLLWCNNIYKAYYFILVMREKNYYAEAVNELSKIRLAGLSGPVRHVAEREVIRRFSREISKPYRILSEIRA